jgi:hypothetical protein
VNKPGEQTLVRAASEDGKVAFAEVGAMGSQGHQWAKLSDDGRQRVTIQSFPAQDKTSQTLGASFDGRYLAYTVTHLLTGWDDWTLYVWDSVSGGAPKEISHSARDAKGDPVTGPINYPIAYHGRVYWPQGTADGTVDIRQYDVTTGRQSVVRAGHPAGPFRMGTLLVWPESPAPDALTKLNAISLDNGQPVALPAVMAGVSGPGAIDATNDTLVWANTDRNALYVWKTSWPEPKRILQIDSGSLDRPHVAGQIVSWDNGKAQFALDLRSGAYTQLTPTAGLTEGWGNALGVGFAPQQNGPGDATVVDTTALPALPRCGASATSGA